MANIVSNLVNAVYVARTIDKKVGFDQVDPVRFSRALKTFADIGYKNGFKTIADKYFKLMDSCGNKSFVNNSYRYLNNVCLAVDNTKSGYTELDPRKMKKGSAVKLFEDIYLKGKSKEQIDALMEKQRTQVVNIKHNVEGYTLEQVYKKIDDFSNIMFRRHPNLIKDAEKVWSDTKDEVNFNFYSRGYNVSGHIKFGEKELETKLLLPPVTKPYVEGIKRKTGQKFEQIFPRLTLPISESAQQN